VCGVIGPATGDDIPCDHLKGLPDKNPGSPFCFTGYFVSPELTIPPALERIVIIGGDGTLVNVMVKLPTANGITGPISPV
jgi:hypothetical protein